MKTSTGYSTLQIALHWGVAVLVVLAYLTSEGAEEAMEVIEDGGTVGFLPHAALGMAVLFLVLLRIAVRVMRGAPAAPGCRGAGRSRRPNGGTGSCIC